MGDVLTLIEEAERKVDRDKAEKLARKMGAGKRFDLEDLRDQVRQMRGMGGGAQRHGTASGDGAASVRGDGPGRRA